MKHFALLLCVLTVAGCVSPRYGEVTPLPTPLPTPSAAPSVTPSAKPSVYNHITSKGAPFDELIHRTYGAKFAITDITDEGYTPPKFVSGDLPAGASSGRGPEGAPYVLVSYLITTEGAVIEPVILKSTDPRLDSLAVQAVQGWRFEPARLKGDVITTTSAREFHIKK